jgi:hypothetical protein
LEVFDLIMVSPKDLGDTNQWIKRLIAGKSHDTKICFKFVCNENNVHEIMQWCIDRHLDGVFFMPQGQYMDEMMENAFHIIKAMDELNINGTLCTRLQTIFMVR